MNVFNKALHLNSIINKKLSIGLVPTMGSLHKGHLSLIKKALVENDQVIVTIFVNPTQFDSSEDIENYPRNLHRDIRMINSISSKILIYTPQSSEIFDSLVKSSSYDFGKLEKIMEGKHRPGHFQGVATVVEKLLSLFKPTKAYFGEKDFQQLLIIKSLVSQKKILTSIIGCSILRDTCGLALSSRNQLLTNDEFKNASFMFEQLTLAKSLWNKNSISDIIKTIEKSFIKNKYFKLHYFDIRFNNNLQKVEYKSEKKARAFIAAKIGKVRLIDNLLLNEF
tara:strand:+ start:4225 stop:5064 length:840 start_codon:yes stop_codon:yes gene_type:complete